MMSELIISVSGLRGVVGESLTPDVAAQYAVAYSQWAPPGPFVIARDGRASGPDLAKAIAAALAGQGRRCLDAGPAATPTVGVLVRQHAAAGGIQISASHNPPEYNGLKLFSRAGSVLSAAVGGEVLKNYHALAGTKLPRAEQPAEPIDDPVSRHVELAAATVDVAAIRKQKFHVLLDSNRGAGGRAGRALLEWLGCRATILGETPDGQFDHPPEPTAENLVSVAARVREIGAAVGFCQDPDADRLAIFDANGRYLGEEYTLAICADHVLSDRPGPIVTNCSTSRMCQDLAERHGVPFFHSAVGEANVVALMQARGAVFGGEGNGGVIDPRVGYVRDSISGMALVLDAMARRQATVAALADALPRYEIVKTKYALPRDRIATAIESLATHFSDARRNELDGLRLDWPDKWLLVRASNTEPIVRAIAEARTQADAASLCDRAGEILTRRA